MKNNGMIFLSQKRSLSLFISTVTMQHSRRNLFYHMTIKMTGKTKRLLQRNRYIRHVGCDAVGELIMRDDQIASSREDLLRPAEAWVHQLAQAVCGWQSESAGVRQIDDRQAGRQAERQQTEHRTPVTRCTSRSHRRKWMGSSHAARSLPDDHPRPVDQPPLAAATLPPASPGHRHTASMGIALHPHACVQDRSPGFSDLSQNLVPPLNLATQGAGAGLDAAACGGRIRGIGCCARVGAQQHRRAVCEPRMGVDGGGGAARAWVRGSCERATRQVSLGAWKGCRECAVRLPGSRAVSCEQGGKLPAAGNRRRFASLCLSAEALGVPDTARPRR